MKPNRLAAPLLIASLAAAAFAVWSPARAMPVGNRAVPQPSKPVDLPRYLGVWYELGRYENSFERGCEAVTAEYRMRPDGMIEVINRCRKGGVAGPAKLAKGRAKVVDGGQGAKLKVSFFGPFFADYWVLDHADDYDWSIVGEPSGRYLWMLTRKAAPPADTRRLIEARVRALGYDTGLIRPTLH